MKMKIRVILGFLTFGMFFMYQMSRFNINISIVAIVHEESKNNYTSNTRWDNKAVLLGAFFYFSWITELIGPFLLAKFGCRLVMTATFLLNAVTCFLFPIAYSLHPILPIVLRAIQGFVLGTTWPAMAWLTSKWIPKNERARFMSTYHGSTFGASFTNLLGGVVIDQIGWQYVFYGTGILSIIWVLCWWPYAYDFPSAHPKISKEELEYLESHIEANITSKKSAEPTPWLDIFMSRPFWAIFIMFFCLLWFIITLAMQMPTYFDTVHSLNIKTNGLLLSIPDILKVFVGIKFPMVVEKLVVREKISMKTGRKILISVGYIIPGILLIFLAFFGNVHIGLASTIIIFAIALNGAGSSSILANIVDISPNHASILMGLVKTASNIPGIISPIIVKFILADGNVENWRTIFLINAAMILGSTFFYLMFSSTDVQPWDKKEVIANKEEHLDLMESSNKTHKISTSQEKSKA